MAEEDVGSGLSGWAGVALGRMWAAHEQSTGETLDWFNRSGRQRAQSPAQPVPPHVHCLATENAQLRVQLDAAKRALANLERDYAELDAWADKASRKLKQHGL